MGKFTYSKRQTMKGKSSSCMMNIQDFTKDVESIRTMRHSVFQNFYCHDTKAAF